MVCSKKVPGSCCPSLHRTTLMWTSYLSECIIRGYTGQLEGSLLVLFTDHIHLVHFAKLCRQAPNVPPIPLLYTAQVQVLSAALRAAQFDSINDYETKHTEESNGKLQNELSTFEASHATMEKNSLSSSSFQDDVSNQSMTSILKSKVSINSSSGWTSKLLRYGQCLPLFAQHLAQQCPVLDWGP